MLIKKKNSGLHLWVDRDATSTSKKKRKYTGFVARHGAIFEDYADNTASLMCMAVLLLYRLLIGCFIGAMQARPDPNDVESRYLQTSALVLLSVCFLFYLVCVRPYHVMLANFAEALVVCCQIACLSRNFWFSEDKSIEDNIAAANAVYWVMLVSILFMFVRLMAVMWPVWGHFPALLRIAFCKLPEWHRKKIERDEIHMERIVKEVSRNVNKPASELRRMSILSLGRTLAQKPRVSGPTVPMTPGERARSKVRSALRKISDVQAIAHEGGVQWQDEWHETDNYGDGPRRRKHFGRSVHDLETPNDWDANVDVFASVVATPHGSYPRQREEDQHIVQDEPHSISSSSDDNDVDAVPLRPARVRARSKLKHALTRLHAAHTLNNDLLAEEQSDGASAESESDGGPTEEELAQQRAEQEERNRILHQRRLKARRRRQRHREKVETESHRHHHHHHHHRHRHKNRTVDNDEGGVTSTPQSVAQSMRRATRAFNRQASMQRLKQMMAAEEERRLRSVDEAAGGQVAARQNMPRNPRQNVGRPQWRS